MIVDSHTMHEKLELNDMSAQHQNVVTNNNVLQMTLIFWAKHVHSWPRALAQSF